MKLTAILLAMLFVAVGVAAQEPECPVCLRIPKVDAAAGSRAVAWPERPLLDGLYDARDEKSADSTQDYYGNGWWWLRSPIDWRDNVACAVHVNGIVRYGSADYVSLAYIGVVPALRVHSSAI